MIRVVVWVGNWTWGWLVGVGRVTGACEKSTNRWVTSASNLVCDGCSYMLCVT